MTLKGNDLSLNWKERKMVSSACNFYLPCPHQLILFQCLLLTQELICIFQRMSFLSFQWLSFWNRNKEVLDCPQSRTFLKNQSMVCLHPQITTSPLTDLIESPVFFLPSITLKMMIILKIIIADISVAHCMPGSVPSILCLYGWLETSADVLPPQPFRAGICLPFPSQGWSSDLFWVTDGNTV